MFTARVFALVAFAVAVTASCSDGMTGVCCNDKPALTPQGYSATQCAAASECVAAGGCAPEQWHMCCQSLNGHIASVCSPPTQGGQ
ncbi:hypothetical protein BV22DRAFT_1038754 [Leucogyrophana mollusca]|uniref:Uncharacterized protein n=1 Tax=Leucogyrophana mollusca TaxID=85980 RepID=A0ACB8B8W5_9AGAM|nr:hypothetical protein BV22DRAFT_1038754 [Leucogyrophana mollusca]